MQGLDGKLFAIFRVNETFNGEQLLAADVLAADFWKSICLSFYQY
jgi:hypothetical protein